MTHRDKSSEEDSLSLIADMRAEEYFSKQQAARRAKLESSMLELREKLGLRPEQTLEDFMGLSPSKGYVPNDAEMELDPEVAKGIDDFFDAFARVYRGDSEFDDAFAKPKNKA